MAKVKKKYIIAGILGVISVFGAIAYLQIKKLLENFDWEFKKIKVRTLTPNLISFDVFLEFINGSDVSFNIVNQEYKIFINNEYVSRGSNGMNNIIQKRSRSQLGVNVAFDPKVVLEQLKINAVDLLTASEKIWIKVEMKFKVKIGPIPFTIPYTYEVNLKEIKSWYFPKRKKS
jgi:LEA14-like dessication related protein